MRWSDIHINAGATALGRKEDVAAAVEAGRYEPELHAAHQYLSVCVADEDQTPLDMAVEAGRAALARSGLSAEDIRLVVHAYVDPQGPAHVMPASYIQGRTTGAKGSAIEVKQGCNGGLAALEVVAGQLTAAPDGTSALVTVSDKYDLPDVDRYRFDSGAVPGDGAAALVLSRSGGVARLVSTAITGDGRFEELDLTGGVKHEGDREAYVAELRRRLLPRLESLRRCERECVEVALADAGVTSSDISCWIFANVGRMFAQQGPRQVYSIDEEKTAWEWGRTVGHLSAGNQIAGLTHLLETRAVHPGDLVALFGGGVGFSVGCAVVEILAEPDWAAAESA